MCFRGGWRREAAVLAGLAAFVLVLAAPALVPGPLPETSAKNTFENTAESTPAPAPSAVPEAAAAATAAPASSAQLAYRAVWVSYLEWQRMDFSSAEAFGAEAAAMLDNIAGLGANVVLAQVRPFGDALYPSALYPFSHLATGTQGADPGFDPLAILVEQAHARGLELEAWVNPYRLQAGGTPAALAETNLANTRPDWVKPAGGGLYLDPASPDVRRYIADGVAELCENYAIDGIHMDDYFYPTTDEAFDAADYAAYCEGTGAPLPLDDWRRENVDALVEACRAVTRAAGVRFGIAPQGQPALCYGAQYSDAAGWLAEGLVDILMPQLYWGRDYTADGDDSLALDTLAAEWLAMDRAPGVSLCFGLGAYRIGEGDGGDRTGPGTEWLSGHALADQAEALAALGADGVGLYRYDSLFANDLYPTFAAQEAQALRGLAAPRG